MIGMQDEDAVERADEHVVDGVVISRGCKHHAHEVAGVVEVFARVDEGLADGVFVGHGDKRRHAG